MTGQKLNSLSKTSKVVLSFLAIGLLVMPLIKAWPISFYFFSSLFLLWLTRGKKNLLLQVAYKATLPVSIWLGIVFLVLLFIKMRDVTEEELRKAERSFIDFGLFIKHFLDFSYLTYLLLILAAVLLSFFIPKIQAVSRFVKLTELTSQLLTIVAIVGSFTFFTSLSVDYKLYHEWKQSVEGVDLLLGERQEVIAKYLLARTLDEPINNINEDEKNRFIILPREINRFDDRISISKRVATHHARKIEQTTAQELGELRKMLTEVEGDEFRNISDHPFNSLDEVEEFSERLQEKESEVAQVRGSLKEGNQALKEIFVKTITLGIPEIESVAKTYIETLISEYSELTFSKILDPRLDLRKRIQALEAKANQFTWKKVIISLSWIGAQELEDAKFKLAVEKVISKEYEVIKKEKKLENWNNEIKKMNKINEKFRKELERFERGRRGR